MFYVGFYGEKQGPKKIKNKIKSATIKTTEVVLGTSPTTCLTKMWFCCFFFPVFTYGSLTTHYPREYKKLSLPVKMTQNPNCTYTGLCDLHLVVLLEIAIICNHFFGSGLTKCYNAAHHAMLT